jgi:hypothetical protein
MSLEKKQGPGEASEFPMAGILGRGGAKNV